MASSAVRVPHPDPDPRAPSTPVQCAEVLVARYDLAVVVVVVLFLWHLAQVPKQ
jgi:hypothetical protein